MPHSCCNPIWRQNVYCADDIFLMERQLNQTLAPHRLNTRVSHQHVMTPHVMSYISVSLDAKNWLPPGLCQCGQGDVRTARVFDDLWNAGCSHPPLPPLVDYASRRCHLPPSHVPRDDDAVLRYA